MRTFDINTISDHADKDRKARFEMIAKTIGFGTPIAEATDKKENGDCVRTLTDTGVLVVIDPYGVIVTAWVASIKQACRIYKEATNNTRMPKKLWNIINYNNNTAEWKKVIA